MAETDSVHPDVQEMSQFRDELKRLADQITSFSQRASHPWARYQARDAAAEVLSASGRLNVAESNYPPQKAE